MEKATNIGQEIRRQIKNKGMTYVEAAKRLGCSKQRLNYVLSEKEDKKWNEWEIEEISVKLRLSKEVIMKWVK